MKELTRIKFIATAFSLLFCLNLNAQQIREIAVPSLNDIAMASYDQYGPVIYYNPQIVKQVGPYLEEYFKAHEYAHHIYNHIKREYFEANRYNRTWVRVKYELEADCYAAKNVSERARKAALLFFKNQGNHKGSQLHPTGFQRRNRILNCSQQ